MFFRTYHRGRRLVVLRNMKGYITSTKLMWVDSVLLPFVILHLVLGKVNFCYGTKEWVILVFSTCNINFLHYIQIKLHRIFSVKCVNLLKTIVHRFLNLSINHPYHLLWFIVIYGNPHVSLIRPIKNVLILLLMITLACVGYICWLIKLRFDQSSWTFTLWYRLSFTPKFKFFVLIRVLSISITPWVLIYKKMVLSIKVLALTPLNKMGL